MSHPQPPVAPRRPYSFERHGVTLEDPWHWLRDPGYPEVTDPEILNYLEAENAYFEQVMAPLQPTVEALFEELKGRIQQDDWSVPVVEHGWAYQWRFAAGQQYRRWYRRPERGGDEQLLLDEVALAEGKDYFRLGGFAPSFDGRLLAYAVDDSGAERFVLRVRDLDSGQLLPFEIPETSGEAAWSRDGRILLYVVVDAEWRPYQVRAHVLGRPVAEDRILYEESDKGFRIELSKAQSEDLVFIETGDHVTSEVRFVTTNDPLAAPVLIAPRTTGRRYEADHAGGRLFILVNDTHPNYRIVTAPLDAPGPEHWQELVPGSDESYLRGVSAFDQFIAISEAVDGLDQIRLRRHDGSEHRIAFPDAAYSVHLGSNPGPRPSALRLEYSSMARPATTWDYDFENRVLTTRKVQEIPSGFDPEQYVTERLLIPARDGTQIPVSLIYRKDWRKAEGRPLHLYGYGAYGYGMPPGFSAQRVSLLDRGFAYAIAHIRGGDELGHAWYEGGKLARRENTFNDFIDVARGLVERGYARAGRISASGRSAGGQLMGVILNRAPELWRAVVAGVPFVDALNTMLDESLPLTPVEWPEWGNPITDPEAFRLIRSYSPYDNVAAQDYPAIMVTAGLNDPRVTYWEPAKWVAKLRTVKTDGNLLVLKTEMGAGHGGKSGRFRGLRDVAEEYAFILHAFGMA